MTAHAKMLDTGVDAQTFCMFEYEGGAMAHMMARMLKLQQTRKKRSDQSHGGQTGTTPVTSESACGRSAGARRRWCRELPEGELASQRWAWWCGAWGWCLVVWWRLDGCSVGAFFELRRLGAIFELRAAGRRRLVKLSVPAPSSLHEEACNADAWLRSLGYKILVSQ